MEPTSQLRRLLRLATGPVGIYFAASALTRAGTFLLIPLYTRAMTREQYGDFGLAQTLVLILATFLSVGTLAAVMRFYFDETDPERAKARVAEAARWLVVLSIGLADLGQIGILLFTEAGRHGLGGRWELSCILWAGAFSGIAGIPSVYLRAAQRTWSAAAFQLVQFLALMVAAYVLVGHYGRGLRGSIEALAIANVASGLAALVFLVVALPADLKTSVLRRALAFSLPFVPHFAATQLQQVGDRWTMKAVHQEHALGGYSLASQLMSPISMLVTAWNDAVTPEMGELTRRGGLPGLRAQFGRLQRGYLLAAIVPSLALMAAMPLMAKVVGGKFVDALWYTPFLAMTAVLETWYYPNSNVLFYANRTRLIPIITVVAGAVNLAANIALVPRYSIGGAIVARAISVGLRSAWMWAAARKAFREAVTPTG